MVFSDEGGTRGAVPVVSIDLTDVEANTLNVKGEITEVAADHFWLLDLFSRPCFILLFLFIFVSLDEMRLVTFGTKGIFLKFYW